jgi:hypothetical protein
MLGQLAILMAVIGQPVEVIRVGMERVVTQLEADILQNQQACGDADCQPQDVGEGIDLVPAQSAQRDFEVVFEHDGILMRNS